MKRKKAAPTQVIITGDPIAPSSNNTVDEILQDIARLYRDRYRALFNKDDPALQVINTQISSLKARLETL